MSFRFIDKFNSLEEETRLFLKSQAPFEINYVEEDPDFCATITVETRRGDNIDCIIKSFDGENFKCVNEEEDLTYYAEISEISLFNLCFISDYLLEN